MLRSALLLLLCCCAGFAATRSAGLRRMGAARLEVCLLNNVCPAQEWCHQQARDFCADAGLEDTCAFGEPEQNTPCGSMRLLRHDGGTP